MKKGSAGDVSSFIGFLIEGYATVSLIGPDRIELLKNVEVNTGNSCLRCLRENLA